MRRAAPERIRLSASVRPYSEPAQAAERSNAKAFFAPSFAWTTTAQDGIGMSAEIVATMMASSSDASVWAISSAGTRRQDRHIGGHLAFGCNVAFANAGALDDPRVGCRHHGLEIGVCQDARRRVTSRAEDA